MKKEWIKNADFHYTLWVDEKKTAEIRIDFNTFGSKASFTIDDKAFAIKRTGFWQSNLEITDSNGAVLLKTYPEKWYANTSIIDAGDRTYKLSIRNNPMAEYVVTENDTEILAYGLATENKALKVRITTAESHTDTLLDCLLWYLFLPIANENFGDAYSFLLVASA